jgi:hypothetical protein
MMMVETIEVGGGSVRSLEILSEYSEKELESQINKRALLKPYVILAFVWSVLIALTTNIITVTMFVLNQFASASGTEILSAAMAEDSGILSLGIIFQCWLSGLFMGKISEGNLASGLKYSAILSITAYISLIVSQDLLADLFGVVAF